MQHLDKNMLQEKLDSIDQLPAGYQPDLNSKWNLLETALDGTTEKQQKKFIVRWSIAASILLFMGLAYYLSVEQKVHPEVKSEISEMEKPEKSTTAKALLSNPVVNSSIAQNKSNIRLQKKIRKQNLMPHAPSNADIAPQENLIENKVAEQMEMPDASLTVITEEKTVRSNMRYVQIDFGSEDQGLQENSISVNNNQGLRLRVLPLEIKLPQSLKQSSSSSMGLHTRF